MVYLERSLKADLKAVYEIHRDVTSRQSSDYNMGCIDFAVELRDLNKNNTGINCTFQVLYIKLPGNNTAIITPRSKLLQQENSRCSECFSMLFRSWIIAGKNIYSKRISWWRQMLHSLAWNQQVITSRHHWHANFGISMSAVQVCMGNPQFKSTGSVCLLNAHVDVTWGTPRAYWGR